MKDNLLLDLPDEQSTIMYACEDGGLLIKQENSIEDCDTIYLTKHQAEQMYLALKEFVESQLNEH
jgi:uncharacterized protein YfcZ (UPF0381/DUF406 family)